ncbi:MAG: aldehyde dehydrogenase family protein, partial [Aestuariivirgaceae bacterium]|nr:aldehyde dehydrogenase family protein [Aestuariivirgaceae bacterium]
MTAQQDIAKSIAALSFPGQAFINGKYVNAVSGKTFDCESPIDGRILTKVAACDAADADIAVKAARAAFVKGHWRNMNPFKRKAILLKLAELMSAHAEELALLETLDTGKPISDARSVDVPSAIQSIQFYAETCDKQYDELAPRKPDSLAMITREPIGVVAAVIPWNYPLIITAWKIGPALATGNCVVLKPAEQSPLTALRIAELAAQAGIPEGVLNVLPGYGEQVGQALGRHMDVDMVAFTGSTNVGKLFLRYAGETNMKHVALETGGKSPNIIFADTPDLDACAANSAAGIFYNAGQTCNAPSRIIVEESIKDQFVELVAKHAASWQAGDPLNPKTSMGAVIDKGQMDRVLGYIETGKNEGATVAAGGKREMTETGGYYIAPTVLSAVRNDMRVAQEEIFGPVVVSISFKDDEEAVRIANDTIYGLHATLWTSDLKRAHT